MTPESMIFDLYGIRIRQAPRDAVFRVFKIDDLHSGFLVASDYASVFGSIITGDRWIVIPGYFKHYMAEQRDTPKIRQEWLIWELARCTLERGERLSQTDKERLALAVTRLEEWL